MSNDNKEISSDEAIKLAHDFLVYRHQLFKERVLKSDRVENLYDVYFDATFEYQDIFEDSDEWVVDFLIKPTVGIIDPDDRQVSVNKITGAVAFKYA